MPRARSTAAKPDAQAQAGTAKASDPAGRIIEGAYQCFERYGVQKTTVDDIAKAAGLPRPHVYRYFAGKEAIVDRICELEVQKANAELRGRLKRSPSFADTVTDALLISTRVAHENPYVRRTLESLDAISRSADPGSPAYAVSRERWRPLLEQAIAAGDIANYLDIDEIVTWLILSQMMLIVKVDAVEISDADLRRFIQVFVVRPLLAQWAPPQPRTRRAASRAQAPQALRRSGPA